MGRQKSVAQALGALLFAAAVVVAAPLDPAERHVVINDGDTLTLQHLGDEYYSVARTEDGFLVVGDGKGVLYYADENGKPSKFKARNARKRSRAERSFLNALDREKPFRAHRDRAARLLDTFAEEQRESRAPWVPTLRAATLEPAIPSVLPSSHHSRGNLRFPIILVAGAADGRVNLDSAGMYARLSAENYTEDGYLGSARDYFADQSSGAFVPTFDVFLVSESEPFENYVGKEYELMARAVRSLLEKYPSFDAALYDGDGDGEVDAFGVLYAGKRYYSTSNPDKHLGGFQTTLKKYKSVVETADGKLFNTCFIVDQGASHVVQLIHEFSHTMGLKDHYCVRSENCNVDFADSIYQAPGAHAWDVMATGMYNGSYRKPPNYNAFERNFMGWLDYTILEVDSLVKAVPPLGTNNFAYYVNVNDKEWYIFENRQQVKWDSGLPNHGMLVWHIDYSASGWLKDTLNDNSRHQHVDIVEAGNLRVNTQKGGYMSQGGGEKQVDDPFPGSQKVTKFSPVLAWDSSVVLAGLFNIVEPDTNVCFTLDSTVAVESCEFVRVSSSSSEPESSSSEESSSSAVPKSSSSAESSSSSVPESSSTEESSSSVAPQSSSSFASESSSSEPESSSSTTFVQRHDAAKLQFRVAMDGRTLYVNAPEAGLKVVRIFDMQGNTLAFATFTGTSYRVELEALARGTPLVVRIESGNRAKNFVVR